MWAPIGCGGQAGTVGERWLLCPSQLPQGAAPGWAPPAGAPSSQGSMHESSDPGPAADKEATQAERKAGSTLSLPARGSGYPGWPKASTWGGTVTTQQEPSAPCPHTQDRSRVGGLGMGGPGLVPSPPPGGLKGLLAVCTNGSHQGSRGPIEAVQIGSPTAVPGVSEIRFHHHAGPCPERELTTQGILITSSRTTSPIVSRWAWTGALPTRTGVGEGSRPQATAQLLQGAGTGRQRLLFRHAFCLT